MPFTDIWLVYRVQQGHHSAFDALYTRHASRIYNLLRRLCSEATLAEDLTQETFIAAYQSLAQWKRQGAFSTWLCGIAINCYRLRCRKAIEGEYNEPLDDNLPATSASDPFASYTELEGLRLLELEITLLPDSCREAFVLVYIEEFSYKKAAELLSIPVGTVQSRLNRAKSLLHKRLTRENKGAATGISLLKTSIKGDNLHVL